jgi:hypothetical protein
MTENCRINDCQKRLLVADLEEALGIIHDLLGLELGSSERAMKFLDDHSPTANDIRGILPNSPADRKAEA